MIVNTVNMDGQNNIVISADVKQEAEKGHNVLAFASTTRQSMYYE